MDLSVIYSKTGKGLRARSSLIGGLSSHLFKVLSYIDGKSKVDAILIKFEITEQQLAVALTQLEREGYIRKTAVLVRATASAEDWALTNNFAPMVVEEFQSEEEVELNARASAQREVARLEDERNAKELEEVRWKAEIKARKEAEKMRIKAEAEDKARAEAKEKARLEKARQETERLEKERIAHEAEETKKKAEAEAKAKLAKIAAEREAEEKAEAAKLEAERVAKAAAQAEQLAKKAEAETLAAEAEQLRVQAEAERKAQEEADKIERAKAKEKASAEAKENARREIERIANEAAEEQKKSEAEALVIAEKTQLEAERKAKVEAEKLEAERIEKAEAEQLRIKAEAERKQADAERKAQAAAEQERAKAEAKAKLEAAEKAKIEAKVSTSREIERIVRKAEEDRKKAEAKAKEERQEAKRKAKAEEDARIKAERKAKAQSEQQRADAEAEEKARAVAQENARIELERFLKQTEEARKVAAAKVVEDALQAAETKTKAADEAREAAESKAMTEAERVRASAEAEEQALMAAKVNARVEMERIGREAEEVRKKSAPEAAKPAVMQQLKVDTRVMEVAEEAAFEEQERIEEEQEEAAREIRRQAKLKAEDRAREEFKRAAREEAAANAKSKIQFKSSKSLDLSKWIGMAKKPMLIYLPLLALLLLALMHVINLSMLVAPIEKLASESLGQPVTIHEVHASLWPQPHLVLADVAIGGDASLKVEAIHVIPETSSFFEEVKMVKSLQFEGMQLSQDDFAKPQQWVNNLGKAQHLKIAQINLKKFMFNIRDLALGPFEGKVELDDTKALKTIHLNGMDSALTLQITPQGSNYDVALTAGNWSLPVSPKIVFDEVKASGTLSQNQIAFSQIEGNIYGGTITGKALVDWSSQWATTGNFDLFKANLPPLLKAFNSSASIEGKVNLAGNFLSQSTEVKKLADAPEITANFELRDGKINDIDLERAVLSRGDKSLLGPPTHFDKLSGNLQTKGGQYQFRQLALDTAQFHARGNVNIQPNQDISGNISADLAAQSRRLHTNFGLAGKVGDVKRE